jgi:hypothetical protein
MANTITVHMDLLFNNINFPLIQCTSSGQYSIILVYDVAD